MGLLISYHLNMENKDCNFEDALDYTFPDDDLNNGLHLGDVYLPEEVIIHILSFVPIKDFLKLRLVCKKWYNLTKIQSLWSTIFRNMNKKLPKQLPWYVYYKYLDNSILDKNLLKNNCGQEKLKHWIILQDRGARTKIEESPVGSDPIPVDVPDFNGAKSCFVTSYTQSIKAQQIPLRGNLTKHIINKFKPHIYVSEWYAGRFDCGGSYQLLAAVYQKTGDVVVHDGQLEGDFFLEMKKEVKFAANEAIQWQKVEIVIKDYPDNIEGILFQHCAKDNQFWAGHYGPKMAGGVVKLLFDSIEPKLNLSSTNENILDLN